MDQEQFVQFNILLPRTNKQRNIWLFSIKEDFQKIMEYT